MEKKTISTIQEPARTIPVRASVDILIVGGGPAGIMAAQAASGKGQKVMLIESRSFLGGNLTLGLPILSFLGRKGNQIIKGLPQQFMDRFAAHHALQGHRACPLHVSITMIDPDLAKTLALELMEECGVEVLLFVFCADVIKEGNDVKGVIIESKAGREAILAKTVIDCTGDGDVACRAGATCEKGDKEGGMQPPTLMFCMKGVDVKRLRDNIADHPEIFDMDTIPNEFFRKEANFIVVGMRGMIRKAREAGIHIPVERTIILTGLAKDEIWVNMSRVSGVDSTDPASNTFGEIEARKQNYEIVRYLKEYVPGFENAWMEKMASFLGIRESRRVVGEYMLTDEDILACRRFDDAIAAASYPVDIHHAQGGDCTLYWCDDCYDIPYRCLVPKGVGNLLVAGRCASTTHEAMGSTRVMSTCMAMGEAAGKAAQIALLDKVSPAKVDVHKVQEALLAEGAYLRR
ncbi:MAG: FAD-dependent oxidoreductase [Alistipes sp.]